MSPLERELAIAQLRRAWGDAAVIEVDSDGDLLVDIDTADGRLSASVASLGCALLMTLKEGQ